MTLTATACTLEEPDEETREPELFRDLRQRSLQHDGIFWKDPNTLCVFDPQVALEFHRANFRDQTLSDRLADIVRRRRSPRHTWPELRAAWTRRLQSQIGTAGPLDLATSMESWCASTVGQSWDLVDWTQEMCGRTLLPWVVDGLDANDRQTLHRDRQCKTRQLLSSGGPPSRWSRARGYWAQVHAGHVVRRELRRRAAGERPPQADLADAVVDLLPSLGLDRAGDAVMALWTAIAGPPGCAMACLLYELLRRPSWRHVLRDELASSTPQELSTSGSRLAPNTHRFIKESLRLWGLPSLMVRPVQVDMELAGESLEAGQTVLLSPYFLQRDPRFWDHPHRFDPDRWLASAPSCPQRRSAAYVPFGWSPRACLGAGLATVQMVLLCRLFLTRFRWVADDLSAAGIEVGTTPRVVGMEGRVEVRS